ncbi:SIS-containing protein [Venustampulla echinocandica]|uniref:SIS-containing protein n=1 Tax=Venustampulla echinocandica TaxID=2656787 RepID=A0A370TQ38_9HELO|nr:SIS-containing protein [Venustampulla echinocandica]RDL37645.1 SIS-containing protein [Venustampulla echinocandica]
MALDHHPVQNSEVYLLNSTHPPSIPPPSPPSPATPCDEHPPILDALGSITPPDIQETCSTFSQRLSNALHVLRTEATSLAHLTKLYETDPIARRGFNSAVEIITRFQGRKGKLVVSGIGKSGHIGVKLVATLKSLKVPSEFLHPTEALHGDLGTIDDDDTVLLITNSGSTSELLALLPHFDPLLPTIIMTSHVHPSDCEIIQHRPSTILLPAPIHIPEEVAFGVKAPTISTTVAIALGDALAIAVARELHGQNLSNLFHKNHPGGAIGAAIQPPRKLSDQVIQIMDIPQVESTLTASQVILSAYQSETGWVRMSGDVMVPPRRIKKLRPMDMEAQATCIAGLTVPQQEWIAMSADLDLTESKEWIRTMRRTIPAGETKYSDEAILVTIDDDEMCGVMEIGELMT